MTKEEFLIKKKKLKQEYKDKLYIEKSIYKRNKTKAEVDHINPPKRSVLEEIGNSVTHGVGTIFSIVAFFLMWNASNRTIDKLSTIIYSLGLFILFTMSCLYHSFRHGSKVKRLFRRFDYSSIYLLIGATFAPILLSYVNNTFGTVFCIIQWCVIAVGITFVAIYGPTKLRVLHMILYMAVGWSGLLFVPRMFNDNFGLFAFVLGGGVVYTLGIIPFALKKKCSHFIWHFFVLAGAITQWIGIYLYIYLTH